MNVIVHISLIQLVEFGVWDTACDMLGLNPYCLNEGANGSDVISLSLEQAKKLGIMDDFA